MEAIDTCYISTACNKTCHASDWGYNDLICFGSCNSVFVYQPEGGDNKPCEIFETIPGHTDRVNCVQWIKHASHSKENEIISGSVDKTVRVWCKQNGQYVEKACLKGHTLSVNAVCGLQVNSDSSPNDTYIASSSTDSTVKIWRQQASNDFEELQTIKFGSGFCLDIVLTVIPGKTVPILALGVDDHKIHIYTLHDNQFNKSMVLTGHEDWVRGLDFTQDDNGDLLLASCAQDNMIRIWRFSQRDSNSGQQPQSIKQLSSDEDIKMRENVFSYSLNGKESYYAVSLESVLSGHDNWIYTVTWQKPLKTENGDYKQAMSLLSTSMDKTMILWQPDTDSKVWVEKVRVGEVGGNTLGFYGGMFSPDGLSIIAHGYQGAFHHWSFNNTTNQWDPSVTGGGHFESVEDIDWDRGGGEFLLSTSIDQTTRLHAPWVRNNRPVKWYEIARPQVHGYDLQCLTMITRYKFATGADEKVARVFEAPKNFLENFCKICDKNLQNELNKKDSVNLAEGASVPALGLSNKAVYNEEKDKKNLDDDAVKWGQQYPEVYFHPQTLLEPPSEENLLQNTLWPECQKLYGHGYEIFSIASDYSGQILATACKASKSEYANIILWDVDTWKQIGSLSGCSLTVTRLAFSHNNQYLLAVSRDRTWSLYAKTTGDGKHVYESCISVDKKTTSHTRIIWDCCWSWDDQYFITASRDKKVMVWCIKDLVNGTVKPCSVLELRESVTAVDIAPQYSVHNNSYLLSVGLDSGRILFYKYSPSDQTSWYLYSQLSQKYSHHLTVKRLKFRPCLGEAGEKETNKSRLQLASCSLDHSVRIYTIHLDKL